MVRPRYIKKSYAREVKAVLLVGIALFMSCAFYSYDAQDYSSLHYTTEVVDVHNCCGVVGAECAALFLYALGMAAYLVPLFFIGCAYWCVKNSDGRVTHEWDRLVASIGLLCVLAGMCCMYQVGTTSEWSLDRYGDSAQNQRYMNVYHEGGGIVGIQFVRALYYVFDHVGGMVCMHVLLYILLILATRFSFMGVACAVLKKGWQMCSFVVKSRVLHTMGSFVIALVLWFYNKLYALCKICLEKMMFCHDKVTVVGDVQHDINNSTYQNSVYDTAGGLQTGVHSDAYASDKVHANASNKYDDGLLQAEVQNKRNNTYDMGGLHADVYSATDGSMLKNVNGDTFFGTFCEHQEAAKTIAKQPVGIEQQATYMLPPVSFFKKGVQTTGDAELKQECEARAQLLQEKLARFGIKGTVVAIKRGPVVTLFEYQPDIDAKLSKIVALEDDLAMALKALSIRIIAPIPGRSVVGFEIANAQRHDVLLADIIHTSEYATYTGALPLILGQDPVGKAVMVDLARMPHLLVAGSTGSGKSVGLNAMLISLLCARTPDELKLILIDPKRLEFTAYADIAHLLFPIITDAKEAVPILKWVAMQMDTRYAQMAECGVRNSVDYNNVCDRDKGRERMPFIVVVIDELADLMIMVGREVEDAITRITQMARAAGIHLIVATQRPSVDVITGLIKVNFPSRISFRVTSRVDSRTILDCGGAEKLLGRGDMLFLDSTGSTLCRVHGAYVSDAEIAQIALHIKAERMVTYLDIHTELQKDEVGLDEKDDILYGHVLHYLDEIESISISLLQRKFKIGYNRSARIISQLASSGRIMPADGSKTRRVIK